MNVTIQRWIDRADRESLRPAIDAIFYAASATKDFASPAARSAFHERWLGRYLDHDPAYVYCAFSGADTVAGYLAGSVDDPATTDRFADIPYFQDFARLTRLYPAHLHVNLGAPFRGQGIGAALVAAFARDARAAGAAGVHVVTARGMRNVGFYLNNGFSECGSTSSNGKEVLFLGRALAD